MKGTHPGPPAPSFSDRRLTQAKIAFVRSRALLYVLKQQSTTVNDETEMTTTIITDYCNYTYHER